MNNFKEREKVKVRGVIEGAIAGSWVEGYYYFCNEFRADGYHHAVHVPELRNMVFVREDQISKF